MKFNEINLFGVYVAPISVMLVAAWVPVIGLRRIADRFGLLASCLASGAVRAGDIDRTSSIVLLAAR